MSSFLCPPFFGFSTPGAPTDGKRHEGLPKKLGVHITRRDPGLNPNAHFRYRILKTGKIDAPNEPELRDPSFFSPFERRFAFTAPTQPRIRVLRKHSNTGRKWMNEGGKKFEQEGDSVQKLRHYGLCHEASEVLFAGSLRQANSC